MTFEFIKRDWQNYHRDVIKNLFPEGGKTVIQAGGNCGMYPRLLAEHFHTVYTFEPTPELFPFVAMNTAGQNVIKMQAGLAEMTGKFIETVDIAPDNCGMTRVQPFNGNGIPVFTIDSFNFQDVDLIFLDTEGCELPILMGSIDTLERCSPKLILEIHSSFVNQISGFLSQYGYSMESHIGPHDYLFGKA
jgi:FkbM family methyltransferase